MNKTATFIVPGLVGIGNSSGLVDAASEYGYHFVSTGADEVMGAPVWGTPPTIPPGTYRVVGGRLVPIVPGLPPEYPVDLLQR